MPEVTLEIGGRNFIVACQAGEEPHLQRAAALLNTEAQALTDAIGRVPETRMLLMAGLMLADRTVGLADQAEAADKRAASIESQMRKVEENAAALATKALHSANEDTARELDEARKTAEAALAALAQATERAEAMAAKVDG